MEIEESFRYLEANVATFSVEDALPALPLPTLKSTLCKYLDSVRPLVTEEEYENTRRIVEEFENGVGVKLQAALSEKAKYGKNWLEDWWLDWTYLKKRTPLAPFLNTSGHYYNLDFINKSGFSGFSVQNAVASLQLYYTLSYFDELRKESVQIDKTRQTYLSMHQHRQLFNTCRIPCENKDKLENYFRTESESKHFEDAFIVIIHKYRLYKLHIYHPISENLLNISELYQVLNDLVRNYESEGYGVGIGALTADYRDSWAQVRKYLISLDEENERKLNTIERAIMVVVLDDEESHDNDELFKISLTGNPRNRFFDKSYQMIVTKNGHLTLNTEHSPFDGIVSVNLSKYVRDKMFRNGMNDVNKVDLYDVRQNLPKAEPIKLVYDETIEKHVEAAANLFRQFASIVDLKTVHIDFCTKLHVKAYKIHPDTFVQMAIQLAYYQLHAKPAPTYETASTRAYYHGRTETMRTCTQEVVDWCKEMHNNNLNDAELFNLLKTAYTKHDKLMLEASQNRGCDRHLLGLLIASQQTLGTELPELFKDISWKKSSNFLISSSCLGFSDTYGGCYPMCEDGYGIFYRVGEDGITFFVSSYNTSNESNTFQMANSLRDAVKKVQNIFEINKG